MQNTFTQDELQDQRAQREKYRKDLFQVNGHQVENIDDLEAYLELLAKREKDIYYEDYKKGGKPITELKEDIKGLPRVYSMIFGSLIRKKEEIKDLQKIFDGAQVFEKHSGIRISTKAIYNKFFSGKTVIDFIKNKAKENNVSEEKINEIIAKAVKEEVKINKANLEDNRTLAQKNSEILAQGKAKGEITQLRFKGKMDYHSPKMIALYEKELKINNNEQLEQNTINALNEEIFEGKGFDATKTTVENHLNALDNVKNTYKTLYGKDDLSYKNEIYGIANLYHKVYAQHQTRSFFNKFFHPFRNSAEKRLINDLKTRLTNLNVTEQDINKLKRGEFDHGAWKEMSSTKFEPQYQQLQDDFKKSIEAQEKQILTDKRESLERLVGRTNVIIKKEGHDTVVARREINPKANNLEKIVESDEEQNVDNDQVIDNNQDNSFIENLKNDANNENANINNDDNVNIDNEIKIESQAKDMEL
ncbi:MAG: hypothetical protein IKP77_04920 [Acholeplasmatales bacterium]|nr:hypothetical protein [Acholeplasmatales bacterium]